MPFDDADILEFRSAYESDTGESLTPEEARDALKRLVVILKIIRDGVPMLDPAALAKFKSPGMVRKRSEKQPDPPRA